MPSPKIGFFDGGKTGARTPNGGIRSTSIPKTGSTNCSPNNSNSVKSVKIPPPKTSTAQTNIKLNSQKNTPKPSEEQPSSKPKIKSGLVTSDISDHTGEPSIQSNEETKIMSIDDICINPSHNVDNDLNKQSNLGNKSSSKTDSPDNNDVDISVTYGSRTPFAVKDSLCDTNETGMEVTEKTVDFPVTESQRKKKNEAF